MYKIRKTNKTEIHWALVIMNGQNPEKKLQILK